MTLQPLQYQYKVPHEQRGRECNFTTISLDLFEGIPPNPELRKKFVQRPFYDSEISNTPVLSCASTNTERKEVESRGQRHKEGGWALTVDCEEVLDVSNYNKRAEREESYLVAAQKLVAEMNKNLRLNCAVDIYGTYYTSPEDAAAAGTTTASTPAISTKSGSGSGERGEQSATQQGEGNDTNPSSVNNLHVSYRDPDTIAKLCCVAKLAVHDARRPPEPSEADQLVLSDLGQGQHAAPTLSTNTATSLALNLVAEPGGGGGLPEGFMAVQSSWTCGSESTRLAVAYSWDPRVGSSTELAAAALWNIHNPSAPEALLFSPFTMEGGASCVSCSSKDSHVIAGGSHQGVVQYWDSRQGGKGPAGHSDPRHSHRGPVSDIKYLLSKGLECFSIGRDGRVLFWDLRNLSRPTESDSVDLGGCMEAGKAGPAGSGLVTLNQQSRSGSTGGSQQAIMSPLMGIGGGKLNQSQTAGSGPTTTVNGGSTVVTASCLDYDPMVGGAHKYTVGTAEGRILCCSRRGRTPAEKITSHYDAHYGRVYDVCRNPANPKYFATIGDWGFKIFGDELKVPFCGSPCGTTYATCGRWHPSRSTVLCVGTANGCVEFWDLLHSVRTPAMRLALTSGENDPLTSIVPHPAGELVAVCSKAGSVYLTQLPPILYTPQSGERQRLTQSFEDEYNRVRSRQHKNKQPRGSVDGTSPFQAGLEGLSYIEPEFAFGSASPELAAQLRILGEAYMTETMTAATPPRQGSKQGTTPGGGGGGAVQFTPRPPAH